MAWVSYTIRYGTQGPWQVFDNTAGLVKAYCSEYQLAVETVAALQRAQT